jgi:predicted nucleic acid-binding Zn ribbon protein
MPHRRINKYERKATRLLLIVAAVAIALIILMMFAMGR